MFEHNPHITPEITLEVLPDGTVTEPDFWPTCVSRECEEFFFKVSVATINVRVMYCIVINGFEINL